MKRKGMILLFLVVMVCFIIGIGGCKKSEETQVDPTGALLQYDGCKQFQGNSNMGQVLVASTNDCLEYQYDGQSTLTLKHINAGFNCCPGDISAEIEFNGDSITITEIEQEQGCHCLCLFDLDYEVINLQPGRYTVRVIEPYVEENDQVLEFTLDLFSATSGSYCLERTFYPWGQ
jgi:hypothetical protein